MVLSVIVVLVEHKPTELSTISTTHIIKNTDLDNLSEIEKAVDKPSF